ncbi:hypothetical protein QTP86_034766 [Hemibagrus guttatus]|nr:hypothetical protein QTP86_034766 [Hemibagrus guttatus]
MMIRYVHVQTSRTTRSDEERDIGWDAWGTWSDCSRTCGGGASYSLRRCLNGANCEGRNIRYRTCSNTDCPAESGDFRAQQCSAHNDIKYQGQTYEWIPVSYDPISPCALKCQARGKSLVVELAPKVLDGTRCKADSLDMCINGICQEVGCDRQLGSNTKPDNCGLCGGDGSSCRLIRGQSQIHVSLEEPLKMVVEVPLGSRGLRLTAKGPAILIIEAHSLSDRKEELVLSSPGSYTLANSTVDYQRGREADRQILRCHGPLTADFTIKVKYAAPKDTVVMFMFYQPIRYQWRETDFFPCSVKCGGGYQLNSADCVDIRYNRTVADHHCHSFPENTKPKPKLKECNMEPCLERLVHTHTPNHQNDGFKEVMPYDHFQPLPRWEQNPWTSCSASCGGGSQERSIVCVEEDMQGQVVQVEEWKCTHSPRPVSKQSCNNFDCPNWLAMEWSQCTVTCGRGLRYRVVVCVDHQGEHTGGCTSELKPHIKEECLVPIACHKPRESVPVEAKVPWLKQAQELEETRVATEEPTFIPGPWSPCSVSCGLGVQKRTVKCRVFLTFTQTEVDLPDEECGEDKPLPQRSCTLEACSKLPDHPQHQQKNQTKSSKKNYFWEYRGFTTCSVSCALGRQTAVIRCVRAGRRELVEDTLCDESLKPQTIMRMCNPQPCPARWEVSTWNACSVSCGVGLQTRSVWCVRSVGANHSEPASNSECRGPRPTEVQACNQVQCVPTWETDEWQECSSSCGRGTQWRKVYCRQRLATGNYRRLQDEECDGVKPDTHRPCVSTQCLKPHLVGGEWSKCSVTCGKGIQRREPVCRRQTASGQLVTLDRTVCIGLQPPPLIRSCRMSPCNSEKHKYSKKRCPQILGLKRIYIQTKQEKRLSFTIGGRAYLFPKTSVVIKCPVRNFPKAQIRWEKDGVDIQSSKHLTITKSGALRIYSLEVGDIGQYRCWANQDSDTFILKLIGHDNRLLEHPEGTKLVKQKVNSSSRTFPNNEGGIVRSKCQDQDEFSLTKKVQKHGQSWLQKNELYLEEDQTKEPVDPMDLGNYLLASTSTSDAVISAASGAFTLEPAEFEELVRNISQLAESGDVTDDLASQLIGKLMEEIAASQATIDKETIQSESKHLDRTPNSSEHSGGKSLKSRSVIVRHSPHGSAMSFQRDLNVNVGRTAYITNATRSLTLLCSAQGIPKPSVSWTKDGVPLQSSTGRLHIANPGAKDVGIYRCTANNEMGSDSETTQVLLADHPAIMASWKNISDLHSTSLKVVVGGRIRTHIGASLTLDCPVTGVPQPSVSWHRLEGKLSANIISLTNGSLLLHNLTLQDDGTYSCVASNPIGKASASSRIHVVGVGAVSYEKSSLLKDVNRKRVVMASRAGTVITVKPGDILRIGCPVVPSHGKPIKWSYENQTLKQTPGLHYRTLAAGRILEVHTQSSRFEGRFACQTNTNNQMISAWIRILSQEFEWRLAEWSTCSASCGNKGSQSRKVHCVSDNGQMMPPLSCQHLPKPFSLTRPCNLHDCPPSWGSTVWSKCSTSCGRGFRQRRVSCQRLDASGSIQVLADATCEGMSRPEHREPCVSEACAEWISGPWGQCSGRCLGPAVATQRRLVMCKKLNSSDTNTACDPRERPALVRNCTSEMCNVHWRVSPWRMCTATCGSGFQSRRVECVHHHNNKTLPDLHCAWQRRPVTWQHCNITSCGNECKDTTHYCAVVKRLRLCPIELYTQRCCKSCSEDSDTI